MLVVVRVDAGARVQAGVQGGEDGVGVFAAAKTRTGVMAAGDDAHKYELHIDESSEEVTKLHQQLLDTVPVYFKLPQLLT